MTSWKPLNMSARVKVKLTAIGYQVYERHMAGLCLSGPRQLVPNVDADGWYENQLWQIANIFGAALYNGCRVPFETEILVKEETP